MKSGILSHAILYLIVGSAVMTFMMTAMNGLDLVDDRGSGRFYARFCGGSLCRGTGRRAIM